MAEVDNLLNDRVCYSLQGVVEAKPFCHKNAGDILAREFAKQVCRLVCRVENDIRIGELSPDL